MAGARARVLYDAPCALVCFDNHNFVGSDKRRRALAQDRHYAVPTPEKAFAGTNLLSFRDKFGQRHLESTQLRADDIITVRGLTRSKAGPRFLLPDSYCYWSLDETEVARSASGEHRFQITFANADGTAVDESKAGQGFRNADRVLLRSVARGSFLSTGDTYLQLQPEDKLNERCVFRISVLAQDMLSRALLEEAKVRKYSACRAGACDGHAIALIDRRRAARAARSAARPAERCV